MRVRHMTATNPTMKGAATPVSARQEGPVENGTGDSRNSTYYLSLDLVPPEAAARRGKSSSREHFPARVPDQTPGKLTDY